MSAPGTQDIRKPLLEAFRGEAPRRFVINDFLELMAEVFSEDLTEMSSNEKNIFKNNINEAKLYLKRKGLLSNPSKSTYMITEKGLKVLEDNPDFIDDNYFAEKLNEKSLTEKINAPSEMIDHADLEVENVVENVVEVEKNEDEPEETEFKETEEEAQVDFIENEFENAVEESVQTVEETADIEIEDAEDFQAPEEEQAEETEELIEVDRASSLRC